MEITQKIKFKSGKEIEVTQEELAELKKEYEIIHYITIREEVPIYHVYPRWPLVTDYPVYPGYPGLQLTDLSFSTFTSDNTKIKEQI